MQVSTYALTKNRLMWNNIYMNDIYLIKEYNPDLKFFKAIRALENKMILKKITKRIEMTDPFEANTSYSLFN